MRSLVSTTLLLSSISAALLLTPFSASACSQKSAGNECPGAQAVQKPAAKTNKSAEETEQRARLRFGSASTENAESSKKIFNTRHGKSNMAHQAILKGQGQ